jgi:acyl dehydratase
MTLAVGEALAPFRIASVDPEAMKTWAVALHDPNPIHLDRAMVAAKGLGNRVINQGPANLAYIINMLLAAFPGGSIHELDVRYVDNVFEGDDVTAGGTVTSVSSDGAEVNCDIWLRAKDRDFVIKGAAVVRTAVA